MFHSESFTGFSVNSIFMIMVSSSLMGRIYFSCNQCLNWNKAADCDDVSIVSNLLNTYRLKHNTRLNQINKTTFSLYLLSTPSDVGGGGQVKVIYLMTLYMETTLFNYSFI